LADINIEVRRSRNGGGKYGWSGLNGILSMQIAAISSDEESMVRHGSISSWRSGVEPLFFENLNAKILLMLRKCACQWIIL